MTGHDDVGQSERRRVLAQSVHRVCGHVLTENGFYMVSRSDLPLIAELGLARYGVLVVLRLLQCYRETCPSYGFAVLQSLAQFARDLGIDRDTAREHLEGLAEFGAIRLDRRAQTGNACRWVISIVFSEREPLDRPINAARKSTTTRGDSRRNPPKPSAGDAQRIGTLASQLVNGQGLTEGKKEDMKKKKSKVFRSEIEFLTYIRSLIGDGKLDEDVATKLLDDALQRRSFGNLAVLEVEGEDPQFSPSD